MGDDVERAEVKAAIGKTVLADGLPVLIKAVQGFAFADSSYRPDQDPVVTLLNDVLDAGLAADKFPSEAEAWASSRVLTKLRQITLQDPIEPPEEQSSPLVMTDVVPETPLAERPSPPTPTSARGDLPASVSSMPPPQPRKAPPRPSQPDSIHALLTQLNALVGLESVKEQVETLVNLAKVRALRTERGLPSPDISFHLVFSGNPGTGKTTVARILGRIYGALGMLSVGKCMEVDRSALIGQYLGQTTTKTADVLTRSFGSVLFLDEAYSLTDGDASDYGDEAISVILKFMEDHRDDFVLIVAGYTDKMQKFLASNPGLHSRFSRVIEFPDYSLEELVEIFRRMCVSDGFTLEEGAKTRLLNTIGARLEPRPTHFANAREVRKVYERALERQANRLAGTFCTDEELNLLRVEDIPSP